MIKIDLPITHVTLKPESSIIKRNGTLDIEKGQIKIKLQNLDPNIREENLILIIRGEEVIIHSYKLEIDDDENNEISILKEKIKVKQTEKRNLEKIKKDNQEMILITKDYFGELHKKFGEGYSNQNLALNDFTTYQSFFIEQITELEQFINNKKFKLSKINDQINELQKELEKVAKQSDDLKRSSLVIILESYLNSQSIEIQLEYTIFDSSEWNIYYNLHIEKSAIKLTKWVSIINKSIENWENIIVTLTDKIRSDINLDYPALSFVDPEKGIEDDYIIPVQTIHMNYKVNIDSDGLENKFELFEEPIQEKEFNYLWNSIEFKEVTEILILSLKNGYLYPGIINIILDGQFIDYLSHNNFTPPGEKIAIPIRTMSNVNISKRALDKTIKEIGLLNKQIETNYSYILSISNPFNHPLSVVIYEQIPKPDLEPQLNKNKHQIRLDKISNVPFKVYNSGMVRWDVTLEAKSTREIDFSINLIHGV